METTTSTTSTASTTPSLATQVADVTDLATAYLADEISTDAFHAGWRVIHASRRAAVQTAVLTAVIGSGGPVENVTTLLAAFASLPAAVTSRKTPELSEDDIAALRMYGASFYVDSNADDDLVATLDHDLVLTYRDKVVAAINAVKIGTRTRTTNDTTLDDLIAGGAVEPGTVLVGSHQGTVCRAMVKEGNVVVPVLADTTGDEMTYNTTGEAGTISAIAGNYRGYATNGWDFFRVGEGADAPRIGTLRSALVW